MRYLPLYFLVIGAVVCLVVPQLFVWHTFLATAISLPIAYGVLRRPGYRLTELLALGLLAWYAGGALQMFVNSYLATGDLPTSYPFESDTLFLSYGLAIVMLAAATLLVGSIFERSFHLGGISRSALFMLLLCSIAVEVAAYKAGELGYMGVQHEQDDGGRISILSGLAIALGSSLPALCIISMGKRKWLNWGLFALCCLLLVPQGRRALLFPLAFAALIYIKEGNVKFHFRSVAVGLVGVLAVILCFQFFYALRMSVWTMGAGKGTEAYLSSAWDMMGDDRSTAVRSAMADNARNRTFILGYLGLYIAQGDRLLHGENIAESTIVSIPSFFIPDKDRLVHATREELIHPHFGIPVFDGPNTLLTDGYADFGPLWAVFLPTVIAVIFSRLVWLIRRFSVDLSTIVFLLFASQIMQIETTLASCICMVRNAAIIIALFTVVMLLRRTFKRRPRLIYRYAR